MLLVKVNRQYYNLKKFDIKISIAIIYILTTINLFGSIQYRINYKKSKKRTKFALKLGQISILV